MAAHIVTGLNYVRDYHDPDTWFTYMETAMRLSCWTEDLNWDEWQELDKIVVQQDVKGLLAFVDRVLPAYEAMHSFLGEPFTREEWIDRMYALPTIAVF